MTSVSEAKEISYLLVFVKEWIKTVPRPLPLHVIPRITVYENSVKQNEKRLGKGLEAMGKKQIPTTK